MIRHCGECALFLTDTDENGNLTEFHFATSDCAFCAIQDLFTTVYAQDVACESFTPQYKENPSDAD